MSSDSQQCSTGVGVFGGPHPSIRVVTPGQAAGAEGSFREAPRWFGTLGGGWSSQKPQREPSYHEITVSCPGFPLDPAGSPVFFSWRGGLGCVFLTVVLKSVPGSANNRQSCAAAFYECSGGQKWVKTNMCDMFIRCEVCQCGATFHRCEYQHFCDSSVLRKWSETFTPPPPSE